MTPAGGLGDEWRVARTIGVGCFTAFLGATSGAMVGVFIGKIVEGLRGCVPPPDIPVCDWWVYAGWGALAGALTLPALVLRRLHRGRDGEPATPAEHSDRG